jgi:competence protein ComEA
MGSTAPPPWRVLEAPATEDGAGGGPGGPATAAGGGASTGDPAGFAKLAVIIGVAVACAGGAFLIATGDGSGTVSIDGGTAITVTSSGTGAAATSGGASGVGATDKLVVEIVGAVRKPGVYRLATGSRVGDLVDAAGGYGPRLDAAAAERILNLAAPLRDGEQIRVPSRYDPATAPGSGGGVGGAGGAASTPAPLVDLNHASQSELEALPGVGPATAGKIIAAREEAPFGAVEELRTRGILGEKTFEKLRTLVTIG